MLRLKHKHLAFLLLATMSATLFGLLLLPGRTLAADLTCPDGFQTTGPVQEKDVICADHKTGGPEPDSGPLAPGCYIESSGGLTRANDCGTNQNPDPTKCYKASASSSGVGTFREFDCSRTDTSGPADFEGDCKNANPTKEDCGIIAYLVTFINVLSGIVGVVIVIMITIGGIQYSTARDNPQAAAAAKGRITNAVMALVFYLFIFAFLQYIVPGGVL